MPNEEIATALKNAIERNEDLEEAGETLVNAGYSMQDVQEAKNLLVKGLLSAQNAAQYEEPVELKETFSKKLSDKINSVSAGIKGIFSSIKQKFKKNPEKEIQEAEVPQISPITSQIKTLPGVPRPIKEKSSRNKLLIATIIALMVLILILIILIIFKKSIMSFFG